MDRLGDVVLSLPALAYLRECLPDARLTFAAQPANRDAIAPFLREREIVAPDATPDSIESVLHGRRFNAAVVLHASRAVFRELAASRVPVRFADSSRLWSVPYITGGMWQRRSLCAKSEAEYCLELVRAFLRKLNVHAPAPTPNSRLTIPCDEADAFSARTVLSSLGVSDPFVLVHPGMGGSALNASELGYAELLAEISRRQSRHLVFSAGPAPGDAVLAEALQMRFGGSRMLPTVSLPVLREVLRRAALVVAPSTGPLHLAHYVGTPSIALFSPVRAHHPRRWKPWGGSGAVTLLMPKVDCPARERCHGERCRYFYCMDTGWDRLLAEEPAGRAAVDPDKGTPAISS
jgi:ADP-heptose:LPS heptosyltransferase